MSNKIYHVALEPQERQDLEDLCRRGRVQARRLSRARALLLADEAQAGPAWPDERISEAVGCGLRTIERLRQRFVEEGLEAALSGKRPVREYRRKLDGEQEAHLIALSCSQPPEGHGRWSLRLLADRMVELGHCEVLSHETVRRVLQKTRSGPGGRSSGASRRSRTRGSSRRWRTCWRFTSGRTTRSARWSAWTRSPSS